MCYVFCLGKKILKKKLSLTYNSSYNAQCPCKHYVFLCLFHPLSKIKCYESHVIFLMYIFSLRCFFLLLSIIFIFRFLNHKLCLNCAVALKMKSHNARRTFCFSQWKLCLQFTRWLLWFCLVPMVFWVDWWVKIEWPLTLDHF